MENEIIVEGEDEIVEPVEPAEGEEDSTDYKALALKNAGIAKRFKTKFEKSKIAEKVEKGVEKVLSQKTGFDYAEKAFLVSNGVDRQDFDYLYEVSKATGKDIEALLDTKHVLAELKERKEGRTTKDAMPSGTKRSGQAASTSVDYWLAKLNAGTATSADIKDVELQRKVVNERRKIAQNVSQFTDIPVI